MLRRIVLSWRPDCSPLQAGSSENEKMRFYTSRHLSSPWSFVLLVALVPLLFNAALEAQVAVGPIEIQSPSAPMIAPTRFAWYCEPSPDETWLASCYGFFQGDVGRIRVWDLKTGKVKWE